MDEQTNCNIFEGKGKKVVRKGLGGLDNGHGCFIEKRCLNKWMFFFAGIAFTATIAALVLIAYHFFTT